MALILTGIAPNTKVTVYKQIPPSTLVLLGVAPNAPVKQIITIQVPQGYLYLYPNIPAGTEQIPNGTLLLASFAPNTKTVFYKQIPSSTLVLTGIAPNTSQTGTVTKQIPSSTLVLTGVAPYPYEKHNIPNGLLTLTSFAPTVTVTMVASTIQVPSSTLNLTGVAPNSFVKVPESIPSSSLVLTVGTPTTQSIVRRKPGSATLRLVSSAPNTSQTGTFTKQIPPAYLRLITNQPKVPSDYIVTRKAGGGPKGHPSKTVIIGRRRHVVHSYTELQKLLSDYLKSQQQELNEIQAKTPEKKKRIRVLKSRVSRTETRLARVHKEWIDQENEELLLLLAG